MKKAHRNNQARSMLAKMTFSERRRLSVNATGAFKRDREQLKSLGKLDRERTVKTENNVPARWADLVPSTVDFTVEGLLRGLVTGVVKPLYDDNGKHACQ